MTEGLFQGSRLMSEGAQAGVTADVAATGRPLGSRWRGGTARAGSKENSEQIRRRGFVLVALDGLRRAAADRHDGLGLGGIWEGAVAFRSHVDDIM